MELARFPPKRRLSQAVAQAREMLWQQAELDKGRAAAAPELRADPTGKEVGGWPASGAMQAAASVPQGGAGMGSQSQSQSTRYESAPSQSEPQK